MKDHTFTRTSQLSGKTTEMTIKLDYRDYARWSSGNGLCQDCLPYLTPDEREFLMTGITPAEWEAMFTVSPQEEQE